MKCVVDKIAHVVTMILYLFVRGSIKRSLKRWTKEEIKTNLIVRLLRHWGAHVLTIIRMKPRRRRARGWWGSRDVTTYRPLAERISVHTSPLARTIRNPFIENLCFRGQSRAPCATFAEITDGTFHC